MNREELEHAIRAACDVTDDTEVWVVGSQAILGEHTDAPIALRHSIEVDISPKNHPERIELINGNLGEDSLFHEAHGFYVHGFPIEDAILPNGWEDRAIPVSGKGWKESTGW